MLDRGYTIFFKNKKDFEANCDKNPSGNGYTYRDFEIQYPTKFPAAFKFISACMPEDPDGQCVYFEGDFETIYSIEKAEINVNIKGLQEDLAYLEALYNEFDMPF